MSLIELKNKKLAIIGFAKEGKSTLNFLKKIGAENITILDKRDLDSFSDDEKEILKEYDIVLGDDYLDNLGIFDYIFKSPGVSPYQEKLVNFREKLIDQTQVFFDNFKGKIIAVTGTKGKSTTTTLIYELLKNSGYNVGIIGNMGLSVLDYLDSDLDYAVYEMSSYMLELKNVNPYISVIVNLYPEHLDYHEGYENYIKAKLNVIGKDSILVYNSQITDQISSCINKKISFGENGDFYFNGNDFYNNDRKLYDSLGLKIFGDHNYTNICAVNTVGEILKIPKDKIEESVKDFSGLEHRLELVCTKNGIIFYDDANSSTPQSAIAAIKSLGSKVETIFLGGSNRGYDFSDLAKLILNSNIKNIILFPDSGKAIKEELENITEDFNQRFRVFETTKMKDAVDFSFEHTLNGKICLLSCASPSYSLWKNFEEKGAEFKKCIFEY